MRGFRRCDTETPAPLTPTSPLWGEGANRRAHITFCNVMYAAERLPYPSGS